MLFILKLAILLTMKKADLNLKEQYFKDLVIKSQNGEELSYRELLISLSPMLRSFIYRHLFNHDQTEDLLQEVLTEVHIALHTYSNKYSFLAWCFSICRYKMFEHLQKSQKIVEKDIMFLEFVEIFVEDKQNSVEELNEQLANALDMLPEKYQKIVIALKIEDLNVKQAAQKLKISRLKLKIRAYRAYKRLRKLLGYL